MAVTRALQSSAVAQRYFQFFLSTSFSTLPLDYEDRFLKSSLMGEACVPYLSATLG